MSAGFYKTVITVTVLSEYGPVSPEIGLDGLARQIQDGRWSGEVESDGGTELTPKEMVEALRSQGSDPSFLGLSDDTNLCDSCMVLDHDTCGDSADCACCRDSRRETT